jgi:hypothetical protein
MIIVLWVGMALIGGAGSVLRFVVDGAIGRWRSTFPARSCSAWSPV